LDGLFFAWCKGHEFLAPLKKRVVSISMDGRDRAPNSVFIERLWRSLKYEQMNSLVASYDFLLYTIKSFGRCRFFVSRTRGRKDRRLFG
jgi:hypothetical protein